MAKEKARMMAEMAKAQGRVRSVCSGCSRAKGVSGSMNMYVEFDVCAVEEAKPGSVDQEVP